MIERCLLARGRLNSNIETKSSNNTNLSVLQVFFIFNTRKLFFIRKDLQALILSVLTWENPVLEPLAVQRLDNLLFM